MFGPRVRIHYAGPYGARTLALLDCSFPPALPVRESGPGRPPAFVTAVLACGFQFTGTAELQEIIRSTRVQDASVRAPVRLAGLVSLLIDGGTVYFPKLDPEARDRADAAWLAAARAGTVLIITTGLTRTGAGSRAAAQFGALLNGIAAPRSDKTS